MRPTSKWHFVLGLPNGSFEIPKVGIPATLGPITLCANLRLGWGLKQSYSCHRELSNDMSHATYTQGNWVDSWLLVIGSQIANLTFDFSFGHNLCFRCPNGSCKPILNVHGSIFFQWYKELFNPLGFDLCNHFLNIWESTGTRTPKVEAPLGVWGFIPSHFPTFLGACSVIFGFPFGPQLCKPLP